MGRKLGVVGGGGGGWGLPWVPEAIYMESGLVFFQDLIQKINKSGYY